MRIPLLILTLLLGPAAAQPAPTTHPFTRLDLGGMPAQAAQFDLLDLTVDTDGRAANPYDPAQADLRLRVRAPSGKTLSVPAFWMVDYTPEGSPRDGGAWHARLTPQEPGEYVLSVETGDGRVRSAPHPLNVAPSRAPGFIRRSPDHPRFFADSRGQPFIPVGPNLAWSTGDVLADYERWFGRLAENGGNFARVWMASWSFGIEWKDTGLGDYAGRQRQAWLLDQVLRMAAQRGIRIELCLINHGAFSETTNAEWKDNPYHRVNGGPLARPGEFATNAQARALFGRRVRYLAARYAAHTSLFAWEWWNEANFTPMGEAELRPWMADMTRVLKTFDPYGHPVSSSFSAGAGAGLWRDPAVDFAQQHLYTGQDLTRELLGAARQFQESAPDKPVLLAEIGHSAGGAGDPDVERVHFHNSLWAPLFLGYAGSGAYWWWDSLIDPQHLWPEYRGVTTFLKDVPLAKLRPVTAGSSHPEVTVRVLRNRDTAAAWLVADDHHASAVLRARQEALLDGTYREGEAPTFREQRTTVTLRGLDDGPYTARWFDPHAARWLPEARVSSVGGVLTLTSPPFRRDLALWVGR